MRFFGGHADVNFFLLYPLGATRKHSLIVRSIRPWLPFYFPSAHRLAYTSESNKTFAGDSYRFGHEEWTSGKLDHPLVDFLLLSLAHVAFRYSILQVVKDRTKRNSTRITSPRKRILWGRRPLFPIYFILMYKFKKLRELVLCSVNYLEIPFTHAYS